MSDGGAKEEIRKLQLTGGSTYIVSLPKGWVKRMGMEKGSNVSITQMEDMTLSLRPEGAGREEEPRRAVIAVTDEITPENVVRRVVSAYLIGYTLIQIRNPLKRIDLAQKRAVKDFTRRKLIGTEIVSDLPRELTLQVLLGRSELSVTDALRRMSVIAASMHREAVIALGADDARLAREVMAIDDEVDRFGLYIIRLLKEAAVDTYSMREIGLTSAREGLGYRLITKSVERMADHAVNIAQNSLALTLSGLGDDLMEGLGLLSEEAVGVFEDSIEALFDWSYASAEEVIGRTERIRGEEAAVVRRIIKNAAPGDVPALRLIVESVMRTAEYGADVAEVVLNLTIRDEIRAG
jgi:phosphate uptake regulator